MTKYILSIDQGTTSSRAILFNKNGAPVSQHQIEHRQHFPQSAWVEHDPEEIWLNVESCCRRVLEKKQITADEVIALGITNQRETTLIWDRKTGKTLYPAIVWQDRRTADVCRTLKADKGLEDEVREKTGLLLDPYFSATKIAWILDHVEGARAKAERGELAFGTIDTFLIWRLTDGAVHATDITNASRTLLFNIETCEWDDELLKLFNIPSQILPEVKACCDDFGETKIPLFNTSIPICGVAGDQQAASIGQACFEPGMIKSTFGTGSFLLMNTGSKRIISQHRLLTTILYQIGDTIHYALEGSVFVAGAAVKWLHDALEIIDTPDETERYARSLRDNGGVYFVPAFTGLGAPYWEPEARGTISGLTLETGRAHIIRAVLEAVAYQSRDLMEAMVQDSEVNPQVLRVDGGMVVNNWLMQFLADILGVSVERPRFKEITALGVAYLAGLKAGVFESMDAVAKLREHDHAFANQMDDLKREQLYAQWKRVIELATMK